MMILRILPVLLLLVVLPDGYLYFHFMRRRFGKWWKHVAWWTPTAVLLAYTVILTLCRDFAPTTAFTLNGYLFLLAVLAIPKALFVVCSGLGRIVMTSLKGKSNYGNIAGLLLSIYAIYAAVFGFTLGPRQFKVRHVDLYFPTLPESFDGYRVAVFSDLHIGTIPQSLLRRAIDSLNAQKADAILFAGDLQNMRPSEIYPYCNELASFHATDGVYSVLGNHDYSVYTADAPAVKVANEREIVSRERSFGWELLLNEHRVIHRGQDSIVIAGEENGGSRHFPDHADAQRTLQGVEDGAFIVLLQHDPSAWRKSILPDTPVQLTISGHTHGGQMSFFGWRPTMLTATEDKGRYEQDGRQLYVTTGLGGFAPFRYSMPPEIVVMTLHRMKAKKGQSSAR